MKAKYILYTLGIALLSSSCSDFLDEDPKGKLTPGTFFSTQEELTMAIKVGINGVGRIG